MISKAEFEKARAWRLRVKLTQRQLADATGFSPEMIYKYDRMAAPPSPGRGRPRTRKPEAINVHAWLRYKRVCGDLDAEMNGRKRGVSFNW